MKIEPVTLEGDHVRLEPLALDHAAQLWAAADYPEIWQWMPFVIRSEDDICHLIANVAKMAQNGSVLAFATISKQSGTAIGSTSYLNIEPAHRRLEIGGTWITPRYQRTAVNTEAKYLLLRHAFEQLGCIRVEFKTDSLNEKSRAALTRIGAQQEGIFRNHMVQPDGRFRHSVYFSVIDSEWRRVKAALETKLGRQHL
jgi:RimJ/RimL family protein N-acetyltransferase